MELSLLSRDHLRLLISFLRETLLLGSSQMSEDELRCLNLERSPIEHVYQRVSVRSERAREIERVLSSFSVLSRHPYE